VLLVRDEWMDFRGYVNNHDNYTCSTPNPHQLHECSPQKIKIRDDDDDDDDNNNNNKCTQ